MPVVSIIIPAYNASRFIQQCIESILNQDFHDWELIIIDDGSTDDTKMICEEYVSTNRKIRFISQKNQGVSVARNKGLCVSLGEYVMFIDADDLLPCHSLRIFREALKLNPSTDILRGEFDAIDILGNKIFTSNKKVLNKLRIYSVDDINKFYFKYIKTEYFLWLMWIRKSCINGILFKEGQIYMEDAWFLFAVMRNIRNCVYIPQVTYSYRKYLGATSSLLNEKKIEDIASLSLFLDELRNAPKNLDSNTLSHAINNCWDIIFNYLLTIGSTQRTIVIKKLDLHDKVMKCVSDGRFGSSDMNDFIHKDIDTFISNYIKRQKYRRIWDEASRLLSYFKARL